MGTEVIVESQTGKPARLPLLDGIRGIAAVVIMLFHVDLTFDVASLLGRTYLLVDFFFMLSGFVLTLSAEPKLQAGLGTMAFMRARYLRFWPVVAVGGVLGTMRQFGLHDPEALAVVAVLGLLMIPMFQHVGMIYPLNSPQWSLMQELLANFLHSLILQRLGDRALLAIAGVAAIALGATIAWFGADNAGPFTFNWWGALPRVAFAYTMGVWMGRKWRAGAGAKLPRAPWLLVLAMPFALVLVLGQLPLPTVPTDIVVATLVLPPLLWLGATAIVPQQADKWLARLGALSFPLYASHLPVLEFATYLGHTGAHRFLAAVLSILVAVCVAQVTERRGRRKAPARPLAGRLSIN